MPSHDAVAAGTLGPRRRVRAEAARRAAVRVRLSPDEAGVVRTAATRAGLSVGAWIGGVAVTRARRESRGEEERPEPASWRELVAALVVLRAEVVAAGLGHAEPAIDVTAGEDAVDPPVPARPPDPALVPGERLTDRSDGEEDVRRRLVERIDAVTATALAAASAATRTSARGGPGRPNGLP